MLRRFVSKLALSLALLPLWACAEAPAQYVEGKHYELLPQPVRVREPGKIEVVEVFWYGCIHCFHFDPVLEAWAAQQPEDVNFVRSPAMWNGRMAIHAQAFYAAEALGALERMHGPLFRALNVERKALADVDELAKFFAQYDVDENDFRKAFSSFGVKSQVKQADARARSYRITGTPELVVNGKYRISSRMVGGQAEMLKVVDFLVEKEREQAKS